MKTSESPAHLRCKRCTIYVFQSMWSSYLLLDKTANAPLYPEVRYNFIIANIWLYLDMVNNKYGGIYSPFSPGQLCCSKGFHTRCPHTGLKAGQMSAHNTAPGTEGSLERFIVKCALTFGAVGVRPSFIDPCKSKQWVTEVRAYLSKPPLEPRFEECSFQMSWGLCHTSWCPRVRFQYAECDLEMFCCDACF